MKINLGSGGKPLSGFINVDKNPKAPNLNIVCDLDYYPWPITSESIQLLVMDQCLEHLVDHNMAMSEIHRILKKGACAKISVPHFTWQFAFHDPTHKHFFGYNTFFYYTKEGGYFEFQFSSCKVKLTFGKRLSIWNYFLEPIFNRFPNAYEQSPLRIFPALNVEVELIK